MTVPLPGGTDANPRRKIVHIAMGGFALLLRVLTWPQAATMAFLAFLFNWQVLPHIGGRSLWRADEHAQGYSRGILIYPLSVLALVLVFRHALWMAAAIWGVLAFGDGMAALVGGRFPQPRLPWNGGKGWAGFGSFVVFGALGSSGLVAWTLGLPLDGILSPWVLRVTVPLVLVCALVESMPTTLDDNLTVPLVGAIVLPLLVLADPSALARDPDLPARLRLGLGVNGVCAGLAFGAGALDRAGALATVVLGTVITAALGLPGLAVMVAFFLAGSAATRLGYGLKAARGIAQERGGARGWRNAWANGAVPAALALVSATAPRGMRSLFVLAYAGAVAAAAADTCSSEIGKAYGRRTVLLASGRPVAPGTEGGVSLEGTLAGLLGGGLVALVGALGGLYATTAALVVATSGLLGSLAESLMGPASERRGFLGHHMLNAVNTAIGAGLAMLFANWLGVARYAVPEGPG